MTADIYLSEIDLDMLHKLARGLNCKQIAIEEGVAHNTVRARMVEVRRLFGATTMPNLIAILIASAVLYLPDLYADMDVHVREYRRNGDHNRKVYRLSQVRV